MSNTAPSAAEGAPVNLKSEAAILEPLGKPGQLAMEPSASVSRPLSAVTTPIVTTAKPSTKISNGLDFPSLRLQASLLAGDVGTWKRLKGRAKSSTIEVRQPSGKVYKAIRIILAVDDCDVEVVETADGIDFWVGGMPIKVVEDSGGSDEEP